jgi:ISXO2-like transposase domain
MKPKWAARRRTSTPTSELQKHKAVVLGLLERGGELRVLPVKNCAASSVLTAISNNFKHGTLIVTDEARVHQQLPRT